MVLLHHSYLLESGGLRNNNRTSQSLNGGRLQSNYQSVHSSRNLSSNKEHHRQDFTLLGILDPRCATHQKPVKESDKKLAFFRGVWQSLPILTRNPWLYERFCLHITGSSKFIHDENLKGTFAYLGNNGMRDYKRRP